MAREDPQMKLRLPIDLKVLLEDAAKLAGRSMNAEIVYRLERSVSSLPGSKPPDMAELMALLEQTNLQLGKMLVEKRGKPPRL
jgi:hypothetical protein